MIENGKITYMSIINSLNINTLRFAILYAISFSVASLDLSITVRSGQLLTHSNLGGTASYAMIGIGMIVGSRCGMFLINYLGLRRTYALSALLCVASGLLSSFSVKNNLFYSFSFSLLLVGIFMGLSNYHRLLVQDMAKVKSPWNTNLVLVSGIIGAIIGPWIAKQISPMPELFYKSYLAVAFFGVIALILCFALPKKHSISQINPNFKISDIEKNTLIYKSLLYLGGLIGFCSYVTMTLVMTSVPLEATERKMTAPDISTLVQWHMVAMYLPIIIVPILMSKIHMLHVLKASLFISIIAFLICAYAIWNYDVNYSILLVTMLIAGIVWAFGYSVSSNIIAINPYGIMYPKFRGIVEVFPPLGLITGSLLAGLTLNYTNFNFVIILASIFLAIPLLVALKESAKFTKYIK